MAQNDDGRQTYCLCPKCEAWDAPDGKTIRMGSKQGIIEHVSMTDRIVKFFNAVAEIVAEELPDRYVGALAYSVYEQPPVRTKLRDNIIIGYVPAMDVYVNDASREAMREGWTKWAAAAKHLFYRPNTLMALHAMPEVYVRRLGEDMRLFAEGDRMMFVDFDCNYQHWATNGLNYYVAAKLIGNPRRCRCDRRRVLRRGLRPGGPDRPALLRRARAHHRRRRRRSSPSHAARHRAALLR